MIPVAEDVDANRGFRIKTVTVHAMLVSSDKVAYVRTARNTKMRLSTKMALISYAKRGLLRSMTILHSSPPFLKREIAFETSCLLSDTFSSLQKTDPVSNLYKSIAGRYRPVRVADGPITARCRFIKDASWGSTLTMIICSQGEHTVFL